MASRTAFHIVVSCPDRHKVHTVLLKSVCEGRLNYGMEKKIAPSIQVEKINEKYICFVLQTDIASQLKTPCLIRQVSNNLKQPINFPHSLHSKRMKGLL